MALGAGTVSSIGGAVSDLFSIHAFETRAAGNRLQAQQYDLARRLAFQNEQFVATSTAIKQSQLDREIYKTTGGEKAEGAAAGFGEAGSSLDLLRESAAQGALTKATLAQQGLIEEAGYEEQSKSYEIMQRSAIMAADADEEAARGASFSAAIKAVAAMASVVG